MVSWSQGTTCIVSDSIRGEATDTLFTFSLLLHNSEPKAQNFIQHNTCITFYMYFITILQIKLVSMTYSCITS